MKDVGTGFFCSSDAATEKHAAGRPRFHLTLKTASIKTVQSDGNKQPALSLLSCHTHSSPILLSFPRISLSLPPLTPHSPPNPHSVSPPVISHQTLMFPSHSFSSLSANFDITGNYTQNWQHRFFFFSSTTSSLRLSFFLSTSLHFHEETFL